MSQLYEARELISKLLEEEKDERKFNQVHKPKIQQQSNMPYLNEDGKLYHISKDKNGNSIKKLIANFFPVPVREIMRDDGQDTELSFEIEGTTSGGRPLPPVQVPSIQFKSMNWVETRWGLCANIEPGTTSRDKVRHAIQLQAAAIPREIIFTHTGWREVQGSWCYLHAGGAVGNNNIGVDLSEAGLERYKLLEPAGKDPVIMSLSLLDIAPRTITIPLWAFCYLAPLMEPLRQIGFEPSFLIWLVGITGCGKSTLAALILCHFGNFNNKSLPASFKDTANFLERRAFILKDSILVVDDYHPTNTGNDATKMQATAQSLCRMSGDRTGRGRMTSDIKVKNSKPARGLVIVTGEDTPSLGESGIARVLTVEINKDDIDFELMTTLQDNSEMLNQAMAGYVQWLVPQIDQLLDKLKQLFLKRRDMAKSGGHRRMAETAAWLYLGWMIGLEYAENQEVISKDKLTELSEEGWQVILELCHRQGQKIAEERPSRLFIGILNELIAAGEVEIHYLTGFEEEGHIILNDLDSHKLFIGWRDDSWLYLLPELTYKAISKFCRDQGNHFPVSKSTLWKNLYSDGLIEVKQNVKERRWTVKKSIGCESHRVVKLDIKCLNN